MSSKANQTSPASEKKLPASGVESVAKTTPDDEKKDEKIEVGQGEKCEMCALQERYKKGSLEVIASNEYKASDFDEYSGSALVSMQRFDEKGRLFETKLTVHSEHILKALRHVIVSHPNVSAGFDSSVDIKKPFIALFHHWTELEEYHKAVEDETEKAHMKLLLDFMSAEMGKWRKDIASMTQNGSIDFVSLWAIYQPGELVYGSEEGHPFVMRVEKTDYEEDIKCGKKFEIHCTQTINDGTGVFRRSQKVVFLEKKLFGGGTPAKIKSLPVFPLKYHDSIEVLLAGLEDRGRRASELTGVLVRRYDGQAMYQKQPPGSWYDPDPSEYDIIWLPCKETGRVVLDGKTFLEDNGSESRDIIRTWPDEYRDWATQRFGSLESGNFVLCCPYIFGYSLQRKDWCKFYVDVVESIRWKANAVDSLVMPAEQRSLLQALISSHEYPENPRETAEQKGKGLVILLHGTPGSGKTLTAEVSAEVARSALLTISLGELYDCSYFQEWKLQELLQYATIWKAVVLIDEADVFLEARTGGSEASSERNALVAVFLRYLEYFSGIVFLTSNRVEDFDAAMKSRIHLALQYDPPASELRRKIWTSRLSALQPTEVSFDIPAIVEELIKHDMNGREIANSINTARTLARNENAKLGTKHLGIVINVWKSFNTSLEELRAKRKIEGKEDSFAHLRKFPAAATPEDVAGTPTWVSRQ